MKEILIDYHDKKVVATVVGDYKVTIPFQLEKHEICLELEQCRGCGVWRSEDEELYGDGYCGGCCVMCIECEQYKPADEMCTDDNPALCLICNSKPE